MIQKLHSTTIQPTPEAVLAVRRAIRVLAIALTQSTLQTLHATLAWLEEGQPVVFPEIHDEIGMTAASEFLNVEVSSLQGLLEMQEIGGRVVQGDTKISVSEALGYKIRQMELRAAALDELTSEARDLDLGY